MFDVVFFYLMKQANTFYVFRTDKFLKNQNKTIFH